MASRVSPFAALVFAFLAAGCAMAGPLSGRASDIWTRNYPLAEGGEVEIVNGNGRVEIEGVEGAIVEIRAERIARGTTDEAAQQILPRISIREDVKPERVSVRTEGVGGIMIAAGYEVRYFVKAPRTAKVRVTNTNGAIALTSLSGNVVARTTNGGVNGKDLSGGIEARSTNGRVTVDVASLSDGRIQLQTTNGGVTLTLPDTAKADLSASCTNGGIDVSGVKVEPSGEQSRRRLEGRINGGGTPIELRTTNGGIRVRARG